MKLVRDTRLLCLAPHVANTAQPGLAVRQPDVPLLYLALFTPLLRHVPVAPGQGDSVLDGFLPGILALLAFTSGSGAGFSTIFELQAGVIERFRVTPASRLALLLGPLVSGHGQHVHLRRFYCWLSASRSGSTMHIGGLLVLGVLLALFYLTHGRLLHADRAAHQGDHGFAAIINGINLPLMLLAGVLLPISLGPAWMGVLAHFNPLYYLVTASRTLALDKFSGGALWQALAVLTPLCAVSLAWATHVYRRAVA